MDAGTLPSVGTFSLARVAFDDSPRRGADGIEPVPSSPSSYHPVHVFGPARDARVFTPARCVRSEAVKMSAKENLELMRTLDDAWNAGPDSPLWETFRKRHRDDVRVYWPAQPLPTIGRQNHDLEAVEFFKTFDNRLDNNPYKIMFGSGDYTCTVADWTVTMKGPMKGPDGRMIPATGKTARLEFCTVATWKDGEIVEERLFYDVVGFMQQLGLSS